MTNEICICSAVKLPDKVVLGKRHFDCFETVKKSGYEGRITQKMQGFMTTLGRFVSRDEGAQLMKAAGIESIRGGYPDRLFSEDLY